ncbi:hypothetical protein CR513_06693, partial [Mucuna pruriens]
MDKTPTATKHLILNSKIGKPAHGAHISSEAALCWPTSTSHVTRVKDRKYIMRWSIRRWASIWKAVVSEPSSPTLSHSSVSESVLSWNNVRYSSPESSSDPLHALDPKIEITLRKLTNVRNTIVSNNGSSNSISNSDNPIFVTNDSDFSECSSYDIKFYCNFCVINFQEPKPMENNDQTLKELAMLDVVYQSWCIQYPQLEPAQSYELKFSLIHLLPKFHGLAGEDPHKHLKEFHVVCSTMRP